MQMNVKKKKNITRNIKPKPEQIKEKLYKTSV